MTNQKGRTCPSEWGSGFETGTPFEFIQFFPSGTRDESLEWNLPGIELDHLMGEESNYSTQTILASHAWRYSPWYHWVLHWWAWFWSPCVPSVSPGASYSKKPGRHWVESSAALQQIQQRWMVPWSGRGRWERGWSGTVLTTPCVDESWGPWISGHQLTSGWQSHLLCSPDEPCCWDEGPKQIQYACINLQTHM